MSGSGHDQLTSSLDSVQAKAHVYQMQPEETSKSEMSEKSVSSPSTKKNVRARSAALERHMKSVTDRSPSETMNHASSTLSACMSCGDREVLKTTQIPALTRFKSACAAEPGLNSSKNQSALYEKDQKHGIPSNDEQNGNQEDVKKKLQAKNVPMAVVASDVQKMPADHQSQKPAQLQVSFILLLISHLYLNSASEFDIVIMQPQYDTLFNMASKGSTFRRFQSRCNIFFVMILFYVCFVWKKKSCPLS